MFSTVRNKSGLLPVALVLAAVSGVFLAESGVKFSTPAVASNIIDATKAGFDQSPGGINFDNLVRIDRKLYSVTAEDYVDLEPITSATVKKISAGRVFNVNIATTTTGTYSTDGMQSKHVLYPGINVEKVTSSELLSSALIVLSKLHTRELLTFIGGLGDSSSEGLEGCDSFGSYVGCK